MLIACMIISIVINITITIIIISIIIIITIIIIIIIIRIILEIIRKCFRPVLILLLRFRCARTAWSVRATGQLQQTQLCFAGRGSAAAPASEARACGQHKHNQHKAVANISLTSPGSKLLSKLNKHN